MPNRDLDSTKEIDDRRPTDDDMVRGGRDDMDDMSNDSDEFEDAEDLDDDEEEDEEGSF